MSKITNRPRRNRKSACIRNLIRETVLTPGNLVLPLFVHDKDESVAIESMPGCMRMCIDDIVKTTETAYNLGVSGVALFPKIPDDLKDSVATESWNEDGLLPRTVKAIKEKVPGILVITDVAMDPYSSDGHDGFVLENGEIDNDKTLEILGKMALCQANAGSDVIAPSDMMDGRVAYIRNALDSKGYTNVLIGSYTVKYCSSFYGPFRNALDSAPRGGDKKTYQMDPANVKEAVREIQLDEEEGADWIMVKPGMPYLDVVKVASQTTSLPIAIYHVSGEFAMLKAASANGWVDYDSCLLETLLCMRRAGASIIFTYGAIDAARLLQKNNNNNNNNNNNTN